MLLHRTLKWPGALVALAVFAAPTAALAASPDAYIRHYEPARQLSVRGAGGALPNNPRSGRIEEISFEAFGDRFTVALQPNYQLVAPLIAQGKVTHGDLHIYTGSLPAAPGSWARFSIDGEAISGVLWDGASLLLIEKAADVKALLLHDVPDETLVVFRPSDLFFRIDAANPNPSATSAGVPADVLLGHTADLLEQSGMMTPPPTRRIGLGVLGDSEWAAIEEPLRQAMTVVNHVDGIFTSQMDIHLRVEQLQLLQGTADPFTGSNAETLLQQLVDFKRSSPEYAPLGLVHLLTRRFLDDNVAGIALLGSVCGPEAGAALSGTLHGLTWIVMAHEIAHNFGAPHDGEPGACAATPKTFLMSPEYNDSDEFSPCSLQEMESFLARAICLMPVGSGEIEVAVQPAPETAYYDERIDISFLVNSIGTDSVFDAGVEVSGGPGFVVEFLAPEPYHASCYGQGPLTGILCSLGNMHSGASYLYHSGIVPRTAGTAEIHVSASATNDTDPTNNRATLTIEIAPATRVVARGDDAANTGRMGTVSTSVRVENVGDFPSAATLRIYTEPGARLATSETSCRQSDAQTLDCDIATLPARSSRAFMVHFTAPDLQLGLEDVYAGPVWLEATTELHGSEPTDRTRHSVFVWGSYTDLRSEVVSAPVGMTQGQTAEFTVAVTNDGPEATGRMGMSIHVGHLNEVIEVAAPGGTCTWSQDRVTCDFAGLAVGEAAEATVRVTAVNRGSDDFLVDAYTSGYDFDRSNDTATVTIDVTGPVKPNPAVAGGGAAAWLLLFLAGILARRGLLARR